MRKHRAKTNPTNYLLLAALLGGVGVVAYYLSNRKEETKASPLPVRPKPQLLDLDLDVDVPEMEGPMPSEDPMDGELVQNVSSWLLRQPGSIVPGLPKPTIDGAEWVDETSVIQTSNGYSFEIVRGKDRMVSISSYTEGPMIVYYKPSGEIIRFS